MPRNPPPEHGKFKKGQSGNPKGRPKKMPELEALLVKVLAEEKEGITAMEAIIRRLRSQAAAGNVKAAEILMDRSYGKVKQKIEVEDTTTVIEVKAKKPPVGYKKEDGKGEKG